jgi:predicted Co/Zn/Cd cation transporter (cation efflux family)
MNETLYKYIVIYFGTLILMVSPYFINLPIGKVGIVIGLSILTIQTQRTKQYNLTILNIVAIFGYLYSLVKSL